MVTSGVVGSVESGVESDVEFGVVAGILGLVEFESGVFSVAHLETSGSPLQQTSGSAWHFHFAKSP